MKRLSVQQRIKKIAQHFTGCEYYFANWAQMNVTLDNVTKPTICYILPPNGTFKTERGSMFTDKPTTQIAFLAPTELDFDGEQNDEVVELMKMLAFLFVVECNKSGMFEFIDGEEIEYQVPYDTLDDCVTGVVITLPIVETPFVLGCNGEIPPIFGYVE